MNRLTKSQREALRLYHQRYKLKSIAEMMDISPNTLGSYLTEAVAVLDAPGRPGAAAMLAAWEAAHPESRGRFSAGDEAPPPQVIILPATGTPPPAAKPWEAWLPFRTSKGEPSDLSHTARILWIIVLAVALAAGFGQLASVASVVTTILQRADRR